MPFIADGSPLENTPDEASNTYAEKISPSFTSNLEAGVKTGLTNTIAQAQARGAYKQGSWLDQALYMGGQAVAETGFTPPEDNEKDYKSLIVQQQQEKMKTEDTLSRFANNHSWPENFASGLASFILDPTQAASAIVPGLGEDVALGALSRAGLGTGIVARTGARAVAGATSGALAQVPLSAAHEAISSVDDQDYSMRDAAFDVFMGAVTGAVFHTGIGTAFHETGLSGPDPVMQEAARLNSRLVKASPEIRQQAMSTAVSQIVEGRPVDVRAVLEDFKPENLEDKDFLVNQRNLTLRSIEALHEAEGSHSEIAELEQSLKVIDNKLYTHSLRDQESAILERVNGNEEELLDEHADELSLIRQELYRTTEQPSDLALMQQQLHRDGYEQSVSQTQLAQTADDIRVAQEEAQTSKTLEDHTAELQELEKQLSIEPVKEGSVRLYHGGENPKSGGSRWFTRYPEYARDYHGGPNKVHYVDVPKEKLEQLSPGFNGEPENGIAPLSNTELPEEIVKQTNPYEFPLQMSQEELQELQASQDRLVQASNEEKGMSQASECLNKAGV